jgi:hypothetical protein
MTEPHKRTNAELWAAVEKGSGDAELARIDALSDEEVDRELREAGIEPGEAARVVERAVAGASASGEGKAERGPVAEVVQLKARSRARWVAYVAAAAGVALVATAIARRDGEPTAPFPAEKLRAEAADACAQSQWKRCAEKLDEARSMDPAGEGDARVKRMRDAIREAVGP